MCTHIPLDRFAYVTYIVKNTILKRKIKMENLTLSIPKISCGHCVMAIENGLTEIKGVLSVKGDASKKTVAVEWDLPATRDAITAKLDEIGYPAAG